MVGIQYNIVGVCLHAVLLTIGVQALEVLPPAAGAPWWAGLAVTLIGFRGIARAVLRNG